MGFSSSSDSRSSFYYGFLSSSAFFVSASFCFIRSSFSLRLVSRACLRAYLAALCSSSWALVWLSSFLRWISLACLACSSSRLERSSRAFLASSNFLLSSSSCYRKSSLVALISYSFSARAFYSLSNSRRHLSWSFFCSRSSGVRAAISYSRAARSFRTLSSTSFSRFASIRLLCLRWVSCITRSRMLSFVWSTLGISFTGWGSWTKSSWCLAGAFSSSWRLSRCYGTTRSGRILLR